MTAYQTEIVPTSGLAIVSTGEYIPEIDTQHSTALQIEQWVRGLKASISDMQSIDELNQAEAMLTAVAKRLKQLDQDAAEAERVRILTYIRIGDLLGPAVIGANQYSNGRVTNIGNPPSQSKYNRDHNCRVFSQHKDIVVPMLPEMKRPSINAVLREIRRLTARVDMPEGGEAVIANMPWEQWLPTQGSCDLLLTDPPYMTDVEDISAFAAKWLPYALAKVKPTGRAYVCIGAYPNELEAYLTVPVPESLALAQVLVWTYRNTLGPTPLLDYKLNWQAVLYYRGVDAPALQSPEMIEQFSVQDINAPDGRQGDRWHPWQKPDALAERFVRHATQPGDVVLDPFAGTGTHLLAAARLGRRGYGCEISADTYEIALQRGCGNAE